MAAKFHQNMIQSYRLNEEGYRGERFRDFPHSLKGNNDLLCLTQPQIIKEIHRAYLDVGSDLIETNSFNSTSIALADYHMSDLACEFNLTAAKIAREVADEYAHVLYKSKRNAKLNPLDLISRRR